MTAGLHLPDHALVAVARVSLLTLRASLFRDLGPAAAALLQDAGFAGGEALFHGFGAWLAARDLPAPESVSASAFGGYASEYFRDAGWGPLEFGVLQSVGTIDSTTWAEADPAYPLNFPGCYYTSGALSDFFSRLAGKPVAVMEVECRSMGSERCRFLTGAGNTLQRVYEEMARGVGYEEALANNTNRRGDQ
jgi:hypothetical protein